MFKSLKFEIYNYIMVRQYKISGMTCAGCTQIVHDAISKVDGLTRVSVNLDEDQASVEMEEPVPIGALQTALKDTLYQISEIATGPTGAGQLPLVDKVSEKNKELVSRYITAVGQLDYEQLHEYLDPDFEYKGAVSFQSAHDYIEMVKDHADSSIADILLKYEIKAIFADKNECFVIYDSVTKFPGRTVPFVEWIKIKNDKIVSTDVRFNDHRMKKLMNEVNKTK